MRRIMCLLRLAPSGDCRYLPLSMDRAAASLFPLEGEESASSVPHIIQAATQDASAFGIRGTFSNSLTPRLRVGGQDVLPTSTVVVEGGPFKPHVQERVGVSASGADEDVDARRDGAAARLLLARPNGQGRRPRRPGCRDRQSMNPAASPWTPVWVRGTAPRRCRPPHTPESGYLRPPTPVPQWSDPWRAKSQRSRRRCRNPNSPTASRACPPSPALDSGLQRRSTNLRLRPARRRSLAFGRQVSAVPSHRRTRQRPRPVAPRAELDARGCAACRVPAAGVGTTPCWPAVQIHLALRTRRSLRRRVFRDGGLKQASCVDADAEPVQVASV